MTGMRVSSYSNERSERKELDDRPASPGMQRPEPGRSSEIRAQGGERRRPRVAAFGEWDTPNLGDRAIHDGVQRFFTECGWEVSSYALGSLAPAATGTARGEEAPAASRNSTAPWLAPGIKRAVRAWRQRYRMRRLLPQLNAVQAISVGGGAALSDANLHFPQSLAVLSEAARTLDKPLLCLGCSAEGAWSVSGERKIREFLGSCTVVAARDEATAERIAAVLSRPVPIFGDFCLTETHVMNDTGWRGPRHGLAINVCRIPPPWSAAQQRYEDTLVALINHVTERATRTSAQRVRIFTTNTPDDMVAAQRVFARLTGEAVELHLPSSLEELAIVLRESALVIATRLHGAILGLAENAPVVGLSPAPKLSNYFSTMGLAEYSLDLAGAARLANWLEAADYASIFAAQHRALTRAPAWAGRAQVRRALKSVAGALSRSEIACT